MSSYMPPWSAGRARDEVSYSQLRVSDAERSEIAGILSQHYSDGRLDEAEFNERLQRAMSAKTRGDLAGLLGDLPLAGPNAHAGPEPRRHRGRTALLIVAVFLFATALSSPYWAWHFPWLLFAVAFFLIWRISHRGSRWHRHGRWDAPGSQVGAGSYPGSGYGTTRGW